MGAHPVVRSRLIGRGAAAVVSALTLAGLVTAAGPVGAQPQPTVSEVQAKLNKLTARENVLIQRYDVVSQNLASARQQLGLVNREVTRDQTQIRAMQGQVAQIASAAYEDGSLTSDAALITSAKPEVVLSQSAILIHLSTTRQQELNAYLTVYRELAGAQQMAKRTEAAIAQIHKQLASQKAALDKLISQQKALLATLTAQQQQNLIGGGGSGGGGGGYHGPTKTQAEKAVAFAYDQIGCPYVYGATGPCSSGYDCSGLTMSAWAYAGVQIPRDSYGQAGLPHIARSDLEPGDIIEFAGESHVGLYVGGGYLIDAPQPGMNVEKISLSSAWYAQNYDFAVRP